MGMTTAIHITPEQRGMLLTILRRFIPGVAVWAYGSRVNGTARTNSDLDLVVFTAPEQRHLVSDLKDELDESNIPFIVDLHVWDELPESFHEVILKKYVVLQKEGEKMTEGARSAG
jgi:predicted nucleotidyltransferase